MLYTHANNHMKRNCVNNARSYYLLLLFSVVENCIFTSVKPALIPRHSCVQNI